jgi:replicative DNA helicase
MTRNVNRFWESNLSLISMVMATSNNKVSIKDLVVDKDSVKALAKMRIFSNIFSVEDLVVRILKAKTFLSGLF